jgi:4-hydroxyacetophenone monooxygenase
MRPVTTTPSPADTPADLARLIGVPFDDSDDVIRAAVAHASVPALLMSMVHMTGDLGLLEELPGPFMLIAMDLQGAMKEKQAGVGGTWLANRYPGCRVDIANQYYTYSFEPTDHWTHFYSEQPEILQYLNDVAERHDITARVRFNTEVTGAAWDEESATWRVTIRRHDGQAETLTARALICAVGQFSNSLIPDIKGAGDFCGPSFHTANWRDDVDLAGKRVAVIGAGASGFQLVPAIAESVQHVDVYQRTPQWMAPNPTYHDAIPDGARWAIRHLPYYGRWSRFVSWWPIADALDEQVRIDPEWDNGGLSSSESNHAIREMFIAWMRVFCDDEELLRKVTPNYPPMGKRTLQDNGTWLTTLQRDNIELVDDGVAEITADGVTARNGVHRPADVLIWATGFDVNHQLGPINVRGLGGVKLNEAWADSAYAYLGITVPGFPNFFCMFGPGTNAVNGASIIYNSECQMRYIMGCIDMLLAGGFDSAMPRVEVCDDYNRRNQERLRAMVYTHPAVTSSYYKNTAGTVRTLYGFRIFDYWTWTNRPNPDDYELRRGLSA